MGVSSSEVSSEGEDVIIYILFLISWDDTGISGRHVVLSRCRGGGGGALDVKTVN